jgi:hypothetical protein
VGPRWSSAPVPYQPPWVRHDSSGFYSSARRGGARARRSHLPAAAAACPPHLRTCPPLSGRELERERRGGRGHRRAPPWVRPVRSRGRGARHVNRRAGEELLPQRSRPPRERREVGGGAAFTEEEGQAHCARDLCTKPWRPALLEHRWICRRRGRRAARCSSCAAAPSRSPLPPKLLPCHTPPKLRLRPCAWEACC